MVENATSNDVAINYVKEKLKNWNGDGLVLDGGIYTYKMLCSYF